MLSATSDGSQPDAVPRIRSIRIICYLPISARTHLPSRRRHPPFRRSMKKTVLRAQATTADGTILTLHEHDGAFMIRVDGVELMSTRQHHSEERLAELACAAVGARSRPRVLIGGLGMGFTLRAALRQLPADAAVTVVELVPAVIAWNLAPEYGLGGDALRDPRVEIIAGDVGDVLARHRRGFDAVILDVDNGASGLTVHANGRLYESAGLGIARKALAAGGCLAVWSAGDDPAFAERLRCAGFDVHVERAPTHPGGGSRNALLIGRLAAAGSREPTAPRSPAASLRDRERTASSSSRRLSSWTGSPISSRRRASIGTGITEYLHRITSSGGP